MGGVNSVATLVIKNSAAASDPFVINTIRNAEALFLAGGDQSTYTDFGRARRSRTRFT